MKTTLLTCLEPKINFEDCEENASAIDADREEAVLIQTWRFKCKVSFKMFPTMTFWLPRYDRQIGSSKKHCHTFMRHWMAPISLVWLETFGRWFAGQFCHRLWCFPVRPIQLVNPSKTRQTMKSHCTMTGWKKLIHKKFQLPDLLARNKRKSYFPPSLHAVNIILAPGAGHCGAKGKQSSSGHRDIPRHRLKGGNVFCFKWHCLAQSTGWN